MSQLTISRAEQRYLLQPVQNSNEEPAENLEPKRAAPKLMDPFNDQTKPPQPDVPVPHDVDAIIRNLRSQEEEIVGSTLGNLLGYVYVNGAKAMYRNFGSVAELQRLRDFLENELDVPNLSASQKSAFYRIIAELDEAIEYGEYVEGPQLVVLFNGGMTLAGGRTLRLGRESEHLLVAGQLGAIFMGELNESFSFLGAGLEYTGRRAIAMRGDDKGRVLYDAHGARASTWYLRGGIISFYAEAGVSPTYDIRNKDLRVGVDGSAGIGFFAYGVIISLAAHVGSSNVNHSSEERDLFGGVALRTHFPHFVGAHKFSD